MRVGEEVSYWEVMAATCVRKRENESERTVKKTSRKLDGNEREIKFN